ncbi:hypothetical protein Ga0100231_005130 [Opitutaceae bacterium TAV4]|nr:hypothetical protein Ga0100231_005130 [Opitutaceae bacterium TAV4]RRK02375.1 hypothetical protein Ga0100230_004260 [Opitutaceae bacterium TAV3]
MTDKKFTKLLQMTARAQNKARDLQRKAEDEYERRYGQNPSDADDDQWIDALHGVAGPCKENITAEDVEMGAVNYAKLPLYRPNT